MKRTIITAISIIASVNCLAQNADSSNALNSQQQNITYEKSQIKQDKALIKEERKALYKDENNYHWKKAKEAREELTIDKNQLEEDKTQLEQYKN